MTLQHCATLLALGLAVSAGAGHAQAGDSETPPQTEIVLIKLHHANQMEVMAGKLAAQKGQSKDVKSFGARLVTDHSAADKKVMALAKDEKIMLPKGPPMTDEKMDRLRSAPPTDFDKMFAADMLEDHKQDIAEAKAARDDATDGKLKALLTSLIPVLEEHRDIAQRLMEKLGASARAAGNGVAPTATK